MKTFWLMVFIYIVGIIVAALDLFVWRP